jgi:hypothetical protein
MKKVTTRRRGRNTRSKPESAEGAENAEGTAIAVWVFAGESDAYRES